MVIRSQLLRLDLSLDISSNVLFIFLAVTVTSTLIVLLVACCILIEMPDLHELWNQNSCLELNSDSRGCAYTGLQMKAFLDKEINQTHTILQQEEEEYSRKETEVRLSYRAIHIEPKPSARYMGKAVEDTCDEVDETNMCVISSWIHNDDVTPSGGFERFGVRFQNGRATVPLTGTYHTYSFLSLHNPKTNHSNNTASVKHSLYVRGMLDSKARPIISNYQNLDVGQSSGSYVNGLVNLRVGDEISVRISDTTLVDDAAAQYNYFGVHLI